MRKVDDGEKKKEKRKEKKRKKKENNDVYSGHYVIASRPPERRPTGTPHARANICHNSCECLRSLSSPFSALDPTNDAQFG